MSSFREAGIQAVNLVPSLDDMKKNERHDSVVNSFVTFAIWMLGPFWPKRGGWSSRCSVGSILKNSFNFWSASSLLRFSRPRSRIFTSIKLPSAKNFSAWRTFTIRSFCAARTVICTCFISVAFWASTLFLLALAFLITKFVIAHHARHGRFRVRRD